MRKYGTYVAGTQKYFSNCSLLFKQLKMWNEMKIGIIIENSTTNIILKPRTFGVSSYLTRKHQKGLDHDQHYWITSRHLSELVSISQAQYGQRI